MIRFFRSRDLHLSVIPNFVHLSHGLSPEHALCALLHSEHASLNLLRFFSLFLDWLALVVVKGIDDRDEGIGEEDSLPSFLFPSVGLSPSLAIRICQLLMCVCVCVFVCYMYISFWEGSVWVLKKGGGGGVEELHTSSLVHM